jgi:hypothetical protein
MTIEYISVPERYRGYEVPRPIREKALRTQTALQRAAVAISKVGDEEDDGSMQQRDGHLQELDHLFKSSMDMVKRTEFLSDSIKATIVYCNENRMPQLRPDDEDEDEVSARDVEVQSLDEVFAQNYQSKQEHYSGLRETAKYNQDHQSRRSYNNFRKAIFDASHDVDEVMPDLETYFEDYEEDQELVVAQERIEYKCPLTKQYYVDPVTSQLCGHSFEKTAIMAVFNDQTRIKCPVPACAHFYGKSDLLEDSQLLAKANAQKEREAKESQRRNQTLERV